MVLNLRAKFSKCKFSGLYPYPKFKRLERRVSHITEGNIEMCSFRKYSYPLPAQRRATELPRGEGVQKEAISEGGGGGVAYRGFLPGGLSKIGELVS